MATPASQDTGNPSAPATKGVATTAPAPPLPKYFNVATEGKLMETKYGNVYGWSYGSRTIMPPELATMIGRIDLRTLRLRLPYCDRCGKRNLAQCYHLGEQDLCVPCSQFLRGESTTDPCKPTPRPRPLNMASAGFVTKMLSLGSFPGYFDTGTTRSYNSGAGGGGTSDNYDYAENAFDFDAPRTRMLQFATAAPAATHQPTRHARWRCDHCFTTAPSGHLHTIPFKKDGVRDATQDFDICDNCFSNLSAAKNAELLEEYGATKWELWTNKPAPEHFSVDSLLEDDDC